MAVGPVTVVTVSGFTVKLARVDKAILSNTAPAPRPMIRKFHIKDFRLCRDVSIDNIGDLVVLVGRNGAGKTNILQAIELAARAASATNPTTGPPPYSPTRPNFSFSIEFETAQTTYRYVLSMPIFPVVGSATRFLNETLDRKEADNWISLLGRQLGSVIIGNQTIQIPPNAPALPAIVAVLPPDDEMVIRAKEVIAFFSSIHYYPLDELAAVVRPSVPVPESAYKSWLANRNAPIGEGNDVLFRIVHMSLEQPDELNVLRELVGPNGLGLLGSIEVHPLRGAAPGSGGDNTFYLVMFSPMRGKGVAPIRIQYDALSTGTRRVMRILASMLFDQSSVMLIEQPEDSLHQGLTKRLIDLLRANAHPSQLILSSHSSALLNKMKPEEVRLVSLSQQDGFTHVRSLTSQELEIAVKFMNDEGTLYDFLDTVQEN